MFRNYVCKGSLVAQIGKCTNHSTREQNVDKCAGGRFLEIVFNANHNHFNAVSSESVTNPTKPSWFDFLLASGFELREFEESVDGTSQSLLVERNSKETTRTRRPSAY
jgi:hypothetical protein